MKFLSGKGVLLRVSQRIDVCLLLNALMRAIHCFIAAERRIETGVKKLLKLVVCQHFRVCRLSLRSIETVSYTHLDVYKRQLLPSIGEPQKWVCHPTDIHG